ncbi:hypothetical protein WICPIJ_009726 [Wickerhamomyces pijperi]|uniref:Uncharacterized protein n=1 Tax=Wickerhamomyces pijperi TaxID=599730 RepID=A0A9P8TCE8_WICPI|nr:hypothetical protein WICPIJ_009726 [Wickerhamomyces pijperi]
MTSEGYRGSQLVEIDHVVWVGGDFDLLVSIEKTSWVSRIVTVFVEKLLTSLIFDEGCNGTLNSAKESICTLCDLCILNIMYAWDSRFTSSSC